MPDIRNRGNAKETIKNRLMYGAMGSAAAIASLLASTCASRCNGCMGCLSGGAGLACILAGTKIMKGMVGRSPKVLKLLSSKD